MKRRTFIKIMGGMAAAWPFGAPAQQTGKIARVGFLGATTASGWARQVDGFRKGLQELGYVEGRNLIIEYRWADGRYERLPALVADLIGSNVDVIVTHGTPGSTAAKKATTDIPVVVALMGDLLAAGIATNLARPGGNITGQSFFAPELNAKRIELLKELLPRTVQVAAITNPDNASAVGPELQALAGAARSLGMELKSYPVRGPAEFENAFRQMAQVGTEAVVISDDGMINANSSAIVTLLDRHRLPSMGRAEFAEAGGLAGYGVDFFAAYQRAAVFVDKILKGTKPGDIPIEQATKFSFVINLRSAKTLGVAVAPALLTRADGVIE
jgi:putative tryptophan/tyrosine transport system substrate-binding protein